ncbi:hypothetical protein ACN47E_009605 [Coniothyrium glycines]
MDSLDTPFSIEINGHPIAKFDADVEDRTPARTGTEPAIFTLKNKHLECGDYILARSITEDRTFLPKQVMWFKNTEENVKRVQAVTAHEKGETYQLKFTNAGLIERDGKVLAELGGDDHSQLVMKPQ